MTTGPVPADIEDDPTGMRALLAGLPDPGPMPDALSARIMAALRAEAEGVGHAAGDAGLGAGRPVVGEIDGDEDLQPLEPPVPIAPASTRHTEISVLDLTRERARRRPDPRRWLAVAAAAGIATLGGAALIDSDLITGSGDAGSSTVAQQEAAASHSTGGRASAVSPNDASVLFEAGRSDLAYTVDGLTDQAAALVSRPPVTRPAEGGDVPTATGAAACAAGLGLPTSQLRVHLGTFEGTPAVLILASADGASWTGGLVAPNCGAGSASYLAGPVTVTAP